VPEKGEGTKEKGDVPDAAGGGGRELGISWFRWGNRK